MVIDQIQFFKQLLLSGQRASQFKHISTDLLKGELTKQPQIHDLSCQLRQGVNLL